MLRGAYSAIIVIYAPIVYAVRGVFSNNNQLRPDSLSLCGAYSAIIVIYAPVVYVARGVFSNNSQLSPRSLCCAGLIQQ